MNPPLTTIPLLRTGEVQIRDFTLLEMQAYAKTYGQQCREAALEEAAQVSEQGFKFAHSGYEIADAIRSIK